MFLLNLSLTHILAAVHLTMYLETHENGTQYSCVLDYMYKPRDQTFMSARVKLNFNPHFSLL